MFALDLDFEANLVLIMQLWFGDSDGDAFDIGMGNELDGNDNVNGDEEDEEGDDDDEEDENHPSNVWLSALFVLLQSQQSS